MEDGPLLRNDHKTNPKLHGRGRVTQVQKILEPFITFERIDIHFKFGTEMEDGPPVYGP